MPFRRSRLSESSRAELALAGVTVIWGSTFVLVKSALADISTVVFLTLRFSVATFALTLIYKKAVRRESVRPGILAGALLFVAYFFQTKGLESTTPSKSAFLTGLAIPMVPLASSLVYKIRPRLFEIVGVLIASTGMGLMTLPAEGFSIGRGDFLSFLCAVTFALHIVVVSHFSPLVGYESVAVLQVATAAFLGAATFGFAEPMRLHANWGVAAAVLITGLLATALAFTTMAWALRYTTATRSALIFALEPVVAWMTSWVLLGERLDLRGKVGAVAILAGVLLVELKRSGSVTEASGNTSN
ncbi:MAG TPA: DMT family transporter [Bryobacteraceae bacterium]|nr:DMT family transporter [Bryobacteraceae bacterium]